MTTLIEFLTARLAEDEATARAATAGPWRYNPGKHYRREWTVEFEESVFAGPTGDSATSIALTGESDDLQSMADAAHIAHHDPARVLREVAAKRRIMERHSRYDGSKHLDYCAGCSSGDDSGYPDVALEDCPELQDMAFIWNENEDWSIAWCPHVEGRYATPVLELPPARGCYTNACNRCGQGDGWHYRNRKDRAA